MQTFSNSFSRISKVPARFNEKLDFPHLVFETGLSPPVKYFTDRPKAILLLWIFYSFPSCVLCLLYLCARLFICALRSPAGKGLTFWLSFVVYNCEFVTFPLVFLVRCGT